VLERHLSVLLMPLIVRVLVDVPLVALFAQVLFAGGGHVFFLACFWGGTRPFRTALLGWNRRKLAHWNVPLE
ncbi:MAG: hypothetical protein JWR80_7054, partial [Bradyrhizobium sp.]|nr:hypothetical protein [Bradyrhizobium sp.]